MNWMIRSAGPVGSATPAKDKQVDNTSLICYSTSMQTFLPFADFDRSAQVLDYRRLGKQRVEAMQIRNTLLGKSKGWRNHPAVRMWEGHESCCLPRYYNAMCKEWVLRGYKQTMEFPLPELCCEDNDELWWWPCEPLHSSHRAALLHKNFEYYSKFGWEEKPELNYVWPVSLREITK